MNIKTIESGRPARYGIALGTLLYVAWRALVRFLVPRDFDRHLLRNR